MYDLSLIKSVIQQLQNIRIPIAFVDSIGVPLYNAMVSLNNFCQNSDKKEDISISDIEVSKEPQVEEDRS